MSDIHKNCFHIFNRGAHKALIFNDASDYDRFINLLYICNSTDSIQLSNLKGKDAFTINRKQTLIGIQAYCLMPNHFHIVLKETNPHGITQFIRKVCTGYVNYYNIKYKHSGTIFQGKYKSKEVVDDEYMKTLINYVHLNPYGIKEPNLTSEAKNENSIEAFEYSRRYEYSSLKDYLGENRKQGLILDVGHR